MASDMKAGIYWFTIYVTAFQLLIGYLELKFLINL